MFDQETLLTVAVTPIKDDSPCGEDLRYDDVFETISSEIKKQQSIYNTEAIDWALVLKKSVSLLQERSKDLRIACWVIRALIYEENVAGLCKGIVMLTALQDSFWGDVYPQKTVSRAKTLQALVPVISDVLETYPADQGNLSDYRMLANELKRLDGFYVEKLPDNAPLLLPLYRELQTQIDRLSATMETPASPSVKKKSMMAHVREATQNLVKPASVNTVTCDQDVTSVLASLKKSTYSLTRHWLQKDLADVRVYAFNRMLTWADITPPAGGHPAPKHSNDLTKEERAKDPVRTLMPFTLKDKVKTYQAYLNKGEFSRLISELEPQLTKHAFWLEGHYLIWQSLQALSMKKAAKAVCVEMDKLLDKHPVLPERLFVDGTPFASEETRQWIENEVLESSVEVTLDYDADTTAVAEWDVVFSQVMASLQTTEFTQAVKPLTDGIQQAEGERERFMWQLTLARLCVRMKKLDIAANLLEMLDHTLQEKQLDQWEPALTLQVLKLRYHCLQKLPEKQVNSKDKQQVYKRLCCADLSAVL